MRRPSRYTPHMLKKFAGKSAPQSHSNNADKICDVALKNIPAKELVADIPCCKSVMESANVVHANPVKKVQATDSKGRTLLQITRGQRKGTIAQSTLPAQLSVLTSDLLAIHIGLAVKELGRRSLVDAFAMAEYVNLTTLAVGYLDRAADKNAPLVKSIAQTVPYWPALISTIPKSDKYNKQLLRRLDVGSKTGLNVSGRARWTKGGIAARYALQILSRLQKQRARVNELSTAESRKSALQTNPTWVVECVKLKPLSVDTAQSWWKVGLLVLHEMIPSPHEEVALRRLVMTDERDKKGDVPKFLSELDSQIVNKIRDSFFNIVSKNGFINTDSAPLPGWLR